MKRINLQGAVVLITGAAGGIGSAMAEAFTEVGAVVVRTDLPGRGADIDLDVTDLAAGHRVMRRVAGERGRLDVVVANAGIGVAGLVDDLDAAAWQRTIDVNIAGTANTVQAALPLMAERRRAAIVLIASLAGLAGTPLLTPYAMSKAAIIGLGESLRPEAARHGIGVTVVCPGPVETTLLDEPASTPGMSVRRHLIAAAGAPMAPSRLAADVISGIRRNKALVVPGRAGLVWRANRIAPGLVRREVAKRMRRELRSAAAS